MTVCYNRYMEKEEDWKTSLTEWYENELFSNPYLEMEENEDGTIVVYEGKQNV